jgi:hypothetical protein
MACTVTAEDDIPVTRLARGNLVEAKLTPGYSA